MSKIKDYIKIENIDFSYGKQNIFSSFSLDIPSAGFVTLLGRNGSGKTTLFELIYGKLNPSKGRILINNIDIRKLTKSEREIYIKENILYMPQSFQLFENMTVFENIKLSIGENADYSKVEEYLKKYDIYQFINKKVSKLSSGERQKVLIIIMLFNNANVLLIDEPTSNLSSEAVELFLQDIVSLSKEKLIIMISHYEKDSNHLSDMIIRLESDNLVEKQGECYKNACIKEKRKKIKFGDITKLFNSRIKFIFSIILIVIFAFMQFILNVASVKEEEVYAESFSEMIVPAVYSKQQLELENEKVVIFGVVSIEDERIIVFIIPISEQFNQDLKLQKDEIIMTDYVYDFFSNVNKDIMQLSNEENKKEVKVKNIIDTNYEKYGEYKPYYGGMYFEKNKYGSTINMDKFSFVYVTEETYNSVLGIQKFRPKIASYLKIDANQRAITIMLDETLKDDEFRLHSPDRKCEVNKEYEVIFKTDEGEIIKKLKYQEDKGLMYGLVCYVSEKVFNELVSKCSMETLLGNRALYVYYLENETQMKSAYEAIKTNQEISYYNYFLAIESMKVYNSFQNNLTIIFIISVIMLITIILTYNKTSNKKEILELLKLRQFYNTDINKKYLIYLILKYLIIFIFANILFLIINNIVLSTNILIIVNYYNMLIILLLMSMTLILDYKF